MTGIAISFSDAWLLDGVRTPFADYNGALANVSPTDLGIKAAREVFARSGVKPADVGMVITGNMAQASFDAFVLPRHVGLYSGVPIEVPAEMVQRVCGTGIEIIMKASDAVSQQRAERGALRRHRIHEPQPDRRLHPPRRLPARAGRVQGLPLGSADGPFRQRQHGRHGGESRAPVPDHAAGGGRIRGQELRPRHRRAEVGLPGGRDRAGDERELRAWRTTSRAGSSSRARRNSPPTPISAPPRSRRWKRSARRSAACRPAAIRRPSSTARRPRWSPPRTTSRSPARRRLPASSRARWSACRPRSWASARCRRSRRCWSARASSSPTSTGSRSTRRSARRSWPAPANSASTRTSSTSTAARSPSATRSAQPACGSPSRWRANCSAPAPATASRRPASAAARASPC